MMRRRMQGFDFRFRPGRTVQTVIDAAIDIVGSTVGAERAEAAFTVSFDAPTGLELRIDNGAGSVLVHGGHDRLRVHGHVRASASTTEDAEALVREVEADPPVRLDGATLLVGSDVHSWSGVTISYEIEAPSDCAVDVHTGSGAQDVSGVASADLVAGSGAIRAEDVNGAVRAEAGSGRVRVKRAGGRVLASTGSGRIEVEEARGAVEATAGSGRIEISDCKGDVRARTGSGALAVRLPVDAGFTLEARTRSGRVSVERDDFVPERDDRNLHRGTAGSGDLHLSLRTGSGCITVE